MMRSLRSLRQNADGTAATEMALVTPMLLALMAGSFELGSYFLDEHALAKAVRDGARYAARLPMSEYYTGNTCAAGNYTGAKLTNIQNVTRTGSVDGTGVSRLRYWKNGYATPPNTSITVVVTCASTATYQGIYTSLLGAIPVVTVKADVKYRSLLGTLGLANPNLHMKAQSQAPVMGI